MNKKKKDKLILQLDNGKTIEILSVENSLDTEDEKYNKVFDDYAKISADIPKA